MEKEGTGAAVRILLPAATRRQWLWLFLKAAAVLFVSEFAVMYLLPVLGAAGSAWGYLVGSVALTLVALAGLYAVGLRPAGTWSVSSPSRYRRVEKRAWAIVLTQVGLLVAGVCVLGLWRNGQRLAARVDEIADHQLALSQELSRRAVLQAMETAHGRLNGGAPPDTAPLRQYAAEFERTLRGLLDGDAELGLPKFESPEVRHQLEVVRGAWVTFADLLQRTEEPTSLEQGSAYGAELEKASQELLTEVENAERLLHEYYSAHRTNVWRWTLFGLLCASAVVAVLMMATFAQLLAQRRWLDAEVDARNEKLARSESWFRAVITASKDAVVAIGPRGRVTLFNPAAEALFGRPAAEVLGQPLDLILPEEVRDRHREYVEEYFRRGGSCRGVVGKTVELTAQRSDGTRVPVELTLSDGEAGGERFVLATIRDITVRKNLEAQLVHSQKLESIGQLAAGVAHEINTPAQFVSDNTRFLRDAFNDLLSVINECRQAVHAAGPERASEGAAAQVAAALGKVELDYLLAEIPKAIEQSLEGLQRVAKIVRAMKEFSHPGGEERKPVDINKAIDSTITVARNEWKYVADVVTDFDPELPLVPVLPGDFNQVILNLLVNAAHAIGDVVRSGTEQKGTITIRTRRDGDWVEIRISDTGTGIPEPIRNRIFDPFFTTKEPGRGTGQGLTIAHAVVVKKHGGTITFETEVGRGTTFIVRLPLGGPVAQGAARESESHSAGG